MEYPTMRRHDRQLSEADAWALLRQCDYGVLALCAQNLPYGVPVSPVLSGSILYFHCAKEGFKIDLIRANPRAHFTAIPRAEVIPAEATVDYASVMAWGGIRVVEDASERLEALEALVRRHMPGYVEDGLRTARKNTSALIVALDVQGLSAKANR